MASMLAGLGHHVVHLASTGAAALRAYGACAPDLVTMDITMPDMDGIEATKLIIRHHPHARIVMCTSHGQEPMVLAALEAGAKGYLLKPVKVDKLKAVIDQIMGREL
jgi:two-component system chemotaxis response regulator CheY